MFVYRRCKSTTELHGQCDRGRGGVAGAFAISFADVPTLLGDARAAPVSVDGRQMRFAGDALERFGVAAIPPG